jgi:hypothetical protein
MHALPSEVVDAGATLAPPDQTPTADLRKPSGANATTIGPGGLVPSSTTGVLREVQPRRRGLWLALGGLAVVGGIAAVVVAAKRESGSTSGSTSTTLDAAVVVVDAAPPVDAALDAAPDATPAVDAKPVRPNSKAEEHLRKAEDAYAAHNNMVQLTQSDLALRADPRNARAKFLYGDALIKYNQIERGCRYLRQVGKKNRACAND